MTYIPRNNGFQKNKKFNKEKVELEFDDCCNSVKVKVDHNFQGIDGGTSYFTLIINDEIPLHLYWLHETDQTALPQIIDLLKKSSNDDFSQDQKKVLEYTINSLQHIVDNYSPKLQVEQNLGRVELEMHRVSPSLGKSIENIVIEEIEECQTSSKNKIGGAAYGMNLNHCIYLATKYEKNFAQRVKFYFINDEVDETLAELRKKQPNSIRVEFYE